MLALGGLFLCRLIKAPAFNVDQVYAPTGFYSRKHYPEKLRRVKYFDKEQNKKLTFLTNQFTLPGNHIADLIDGRWQKLNCSLKWIKQHLRIKAFYGTSQNAVKTQIWIAIFSICPCCDNEKRD